MTFVRTTVSIAVLSSAAMFTSSWAAADKQHDAHHPAPTTVTQVAQAQPAATRMGMRAGAGKPADMAARQGMMEQRMDMMQSMMQMRMDRMPAVPATK